MKRTIAAIALSLLSAGALADLIFEHEGHTYRLVENPASWDEATATAAAMSLGGETGYLARIDSASENERHLVGDVGASQSCPACQYHS